MVVCRSSLKSLIDQSLFCPMATVISYHILLKEFRNFVSKGRLFNLQLYLELIAKTNRNHQIILNEIPIEVNKWRVIDNLKIKQIS